MCMSHPAADGRTADSGSQSQPNLGSWPMAPATLGYAQLLMECQARGLQRDLIGQLLKIALIEKEKDIIERDVACLKMITGANKEYYGVGRISQARLLEAQNTLAIRNEELTNASNNRRVEIAGLNRLLGRALDSPGLELDLPEPAPPLSSTEGFAELSVRNSLILQALDQQAAQPQTRSDISSCEIIRLERAGCEAMSREAVLRLIVQIDAARRESLLFRNEILPRARQAVGGAQAVCEVDQGGFCTLLQARRDALEDELRYARAVARQHALLADLCMVCALDYWENLAPLGSK